MMPGMLAARESRAQDRYASVTTMDFYLYMGLEPSKPPSERLGRHKGELGERQGTLPEVPSPRYACPLCPTSGG